MIALGSARPVREGAGGLTRRSLVYRRNPRGTSVASWHRYPSLRADLPGDAGVARGQLRRFPVPEQTGRAAPSGSRQESVAVARTRHLSGACAACHGNDGRGDGPIAAQLVGPPVGNLTDNEWKHGDRPEQVLAVIGQGVPNTRMDGWSRVLDPPELKAVAAYVYYLAKQPVPEALREP